MKKPSRRTFYVYEHWRPDTNQCFYVGKGHAKRAYFFKRNSNGYNIVIKILERKGLSVLVKFVATKLSEKEAFNVEIKRIAFWKSEGIKLTNKSDGGEGPTGELHSVSMTIANARPETKRRHQLAALRAHADPIIKERHRTGCRQAQNRPEVKAKIRKATIAARADLVLEKQRNKTLRKTLTQPEVRERKRRAMLEVHSRPGMTKKMNERAILALSDPDVRNRIRQATLGSRWIHKGQVRRRLKPGSPLPQEWKFGIRS